MVEYNKAKQRNYSMASIDAIIKLMVFTITSTVKYRVTLQQVYNTAKRAMSTTDVDADTLHRAAKAAVLS